MKKSQLHESSDVLIIGAGLSGLMAAHTLRASGKRILLLDKGRSVGGRLATRRIGPGRADTGAQFFTVRDAGFQKYVDRWLASGLVYQWSSGWSRGSLGDDTATAGDGYPRYAVRSGFNALAKHLAAEVEEAGVRVQVDVRVKSVSLRDRCWSVEDEGGRTYTGESLVLTPPVPQSLALLDAGGTKLDDDDRAALERIVYAPCLCGLFWVDGEVDLPEPGAVQTPEEEISWIADNRRKGVSPAATLITVHAGPSFSRHHYDDNDNSVLSRMLLTLQPQMAAGATIHEAQLKRWRYAQPEVLHPQSYLHACALPPLYFGGDAFGGPRVEGAALSGLSIGQTIARG